MVFQRGLQGGVYIYMYISTDICIYPGMKKGSYYSGFRFSGYYLGTAPTHQWLDKIYVMILLSP